jgi:hypothetical protein
VSRSGKETQNREVVTVNLQISTYIRKNISPPGATPVIGNPAPQRNLADDKRQKEVRAE